MRIRNPAGMMRLKVKGNDLFLEKAEFYLAKTREYGIIKKRYHKRKSELKFESN